MRAAAFLLLAGCALESWTTPQPVFKVREPQGAFARAVAATQAQCGGVRSANEESGVIISPWEAWNTGDGVILTQCLVSLLRGDEHVVDVRVTFAARRCPLVSMDDLEAALPTCEVVETVPSQVKNGLEQRGQQLEAAITVPAR